MIRYITNSELAGWRRCRRRWWLSTYRRIGLKPQYQKPGAAYTGTMVHDALEAYYAGDDWKVRLNGHLENIEEMDSSHGDRWNKFIKMHELATIMLEGYIEWLAETGADSSWEILSTETILSCPWTERGEKEIHLRGKLDLRIRDHAVDDQPMFVDHKTVPNMTDIPSRADRDEQFLFYETLHRAAMNETTAGGIFNMLRKVKRTARATPPFYERHVVRFNERQLDVIATRITALINEILTAEELLDRGVDHQQVCPPTPSGSCGWDCDYSSICSMFDDTSRVEDYITDWYDERNPMERYEKEPKSR